MIDLLLCFPDYSTAAQVGVALGFTAQNGDGTYRTTQATETLGICVIGEHFYQTGNTITIDGRTVPEFAGDGKWWVMVRGLVELPVPEAIQPYVVTPNPADPLIPNVRWA
jgi:hypothetical protein